MILRRNHSVRAGLTLGITALALFGAGTAQGANTITVCPAGPPECQYGTVQEGLIAASNGDRILIAPGSYSAALTIAKNVSLIGSGESQTTLSGGQVGVTIAAGATVAIRGLTVSDAAETGIANLGTLTLRETTATANGLTDFNGPGGVFNSGTLTLWHSTVRENGWGPGFPSVGGIENDGVLALHDSAVIHNRGDHGGLDNEGSATITRSILDRNGGFSGGNIVNGGYLELRRSTVAGGICEGACGIFNHNVAVVVDSVVTRNGGLGSHHGPITNDGGTLTIRGSSIRANEGALGSPGALSNVAGAVTIEGSVVTVNTSLDGDAAIKNWGTMDLRNSNILRNTGGGGIENNGQMTLWESTVGDNVNTDLFGPGGGGVHNLGTLTLGSSRVSDNTAQTLGGGILNEGSIELEQSVVTRNTAVEGMNGIFGGGIYNSGTIRLRHSRVSGNSPDDCVGC